MLISHLISTEVFLYFLPYHITLLSPLKVPKLGSVCIVNVHVNVHIITFNHLIET